MPDLNTFDIIILILILLMSIKGFINGFLRELFGFIGLIGGIFVASRTAEPIAKYIDTNILHLDNFSALKLIGFLAVLASVWMIISFIGNLIVGISKKQPHNILNSFLGFLTAGIKYFLIFSLIISAIFRTPLIKDNVAGKISGSKLYPTLNTVGSNLINLAPIGSKKR